MLKGLNRRHVLGGLGLGLVGSMAGRVAAQDARELVWEDLLPVGVPYSEIIGDGDYDEVNDTWRPIFDENATKVVTSLDGQRVRLPGYIVPLQYSGDGVTVFILAPYAGACIHVPPPPANQLVYVTTAAPYPNEGIFDAVWVTGTIQAQASTTDLAQIGYAMVADDIELYEWM